MKRLTISLFLLISSLIAIQAKEITFTAKAKNAVLVGEKFQLVYSLNTEGSDLRIPSIKDFQILLGPRTSTSSSIQIINGDMKKSVSYTYTYVLKANKEGQYKIPPATINVNGNKIESNAINIQVVKGQGNQTNSQQKKSQSGSTFNKEDLFIKVAASKTNVYHGESLVLTTKIYTRIDLDAISDIKYPEMRNFLANDLSKSEDIQWGYENIGTKTYRVGTFNRKLVFPQKPGKLTISPTEIEFMVRQRVARQSRGIFDDFFDSGYRTVKKRSKSNALTINVKPLPAGRPSDFSGEVGKLSLKATVTKSEVTVNDGVTLKVTISGTGNHKLANAPKIKFPADFDDFDPKITNNLSTTIAGTKGSKSFEYLLIPRHSGSFTIPEFSLPYFNPQTGKYERASAGPFTIEVLKGDQEEESSTITTRITSREDVKFLGKDIRHIKRGAIELKPVGTFLFGSKLFYILMLLPLFLLIVAIAFNKKRLKDSANSTLSKNRKANKVAVKRLKKAAHLLKSNEKEAFYDEVMRALWGYLSDKLNLPVSELTKDNASSVLAQNNVSKEVTERFMDILDTCEFARFSPESGSSQMDQLYKSTLENIGKLENQIKK